MKADFTKRHSGPEIMDDESSDHQKLLNTLKQFTLINILLSASRSLIKKHLIPSMKPNTQRPYSFLDIGAGGCDISLWLLKYCKKKRLIFR